MESKQHGIGVMASYGMGKFLAEFLTGAYGAIAYKYYETTVGLSGLLVAIATIIYSVWNAINDPFIGFASNRKAPFSKILGKRFVWIILGLALCAILFAIIFGVPQSMRNTVATSPLAVFVWMVITICLYDASYSLWEVNYQAVYPDKFRSQSERTKAAAISTGVGVLGVAAGFIVPPMFFDYDNPESFFTMGLIVAAITFIGIILLLPGIKETKEMIGRQQVQAKRTKETAGEKMGFFTSMRKALQHKELVSFVVLLFLYQSACMCMTSSIHYVGDYILNVPASGTTIIFAGMLIGALVSIPIWTAISKKMKNNQRLLIVASLAMAVFAFPMTFISSSIGFTIFMALWGLGFGGFWTFMGPAMADVVDSIVVKEKKRQEGIYMGIRAFFMRFSIASQALVFYIVHEATGFDEHNITGLAKFGISLHMAAIPAIFFLLGALYFYKTNILDPKTIENNRKKLELLDI
ncbi:MAG: MFS transporter [Sphaerochaetaceae bacterium]|jgi:GPH family glycoside/pentoside/hexuronide:cation symporter|nr:MFS transporter [Sphaerochaetaceae bacterium]NLO60514.1 MFS transporter [Spirochaetales bacterium]MDD2406344.1 MFS transporter [Sphaerochaetaceae bacterium]MDD3670542.1 MFS transporter [Sphaerochaetaceae bacterium]MDD4258234.1 MFS transporter [Sphaerochaetaceae bacterium]